ncbi:MAG: hypothetical protein FWG20_02995, partial [Candidatus Cloacimonetes bacterium]|nr:hypothetical protein [Candidatus Cloacimonadota bacterium]
HNNKRNFKGNNMNKKTRYLWVALAIFCLILVSCSTEKGRVKIGNGGYSVKSPVGWDVRAVPGAEYEIIVSPLNNGYAATISFSDGNYSGDFQQYLDAMFRVYETDTQGFQQAYQSDFSTDSHHNGQRFVMVTTQQNATMKLAMYFIKISNDKYLSIYCAAREGSFDEYAQAFDACARSFKVN